MVILQQIIVRQNLFIEGNALLSSSIAGEPRDTTRTFNPKFDANGLITAIVIDGQTKDILMVAHMNQEAIDETQRTHVAHFWSRSRQQLWKKGETSGNVMNVTDIRVDCDQDAVLLFVEPSGPACHTGERSCFYRQLSGDTLVKVNS